MTDSQNEPFLATLTPKAWRALAVKRARLAFFRPGLTGAALRAHLKAAITADPLGQGATANPAHTLFHQAMLTSGAVGGKHRDDLTRALIGAPEQTAGLGSPPQAQPPPQQVEVKPRRGL